MKPVIVVHGGAGSWDLSHNRMDRALADCRAAAQAGQDILIGGGSALDAVEAAVRVMEDSPVLDAGRGSYLNADGEIEMDALIMDGATMDLGAVAAVKLIRHPISLARKVMTDCEHNFLVAGGAETFATNMGFPRCDIYDLLSEDQLEFFLSLDKRDEVITEALLLGESAIGDTVGAVALDQGGDLAAATSTGGTRGKLPGRVGDSPLVGSGAYADNWTAAVSATGHGEALMKVLISKRVCDFVADGLSTQKACEAAIDVLTERVHGLGGVISVDVRGRIGIAFNTVAMPYAFAIGDKPLVSGREPLH